MIRNCHKYLKLPPGRRGHLVNLLLLRNFRKLLKLLVIFTPPPPPHCVITACQSQKVNSLRTHTGERFGSNLKLKRLFVSSASPVTCGFSTEGRSTNRAPSSPSPRGPAGQISIFALLVFPALFILFAMSLNIALVVHDKINLQNSVDIAAYYGAMKQAEMLNAIAHINYQIRQSWKLLTWRYRVLGSMGLTDIRDPLWGNSARFSDEEHWLPVYSRSVSFPRNQGPYFFCVGHFDWGGLLGNSAEFISRNDELDRDLLCSEMESTISALPIPRISSGVALVTSTLRGVAKMTENMNVALRDKCDIYGFNSWLLGALSFVLFYQDQHDRKKMIHTIAQALITGKDLDNGSIQTGVEKTLKKNLTFVNKKAFSSSSSSLVHWSSLAGENHRSPRQVSALLEDQPAYPVGLYSNFTGRGGCQKDFKMITEPHSSRNRSDTLLNNIIMELKAYGSLWPGCALSGAPCNPSAGLKKKQLMVYYGVKAELDYQNQIFLPFKLTLKAKAFAKPFGGRIGPNKSQDRLLSQKTDGAPLSAGFMAIDREFSPNYSRYPKDRWGLRSKLVHGYWANHIKRTNRYEKNINFYLKGDKHPNDRDPMARNHRGNPGTSITARKWEIAAIAPDLFDVTYFTILPYYQYDYFPRLAQGIFLNDKSFLRGDLGTYYNPGTNTFAGTSILKPFISITGYSGQYANNVWQELQRESSPLQKPAYKIRDLQGLLTAWNPPKNKYTSGTNYSEIDQTDFGDCSKWVHTINGGSIMKRNPLTKKGIIANGCIFGGRTGYSVKMIHQDRLPGHNQPPW